MAMRVEVLCRSEKCGGRPLLGALVGRVDPHQCIFRNGSAIIDGDEARAGHSEGIVHPMSWLVKQGLLKVTQR